MKTMLKLLYSFLALTIISIVLHNVISGYLKKDEPFFFVLTFVFIALAAFFSVYSLVHYFRKKK